METCKKMALLAVLALGLALGNAGCGSGASLLVCFQDSPIREYDVYIKDYTSNRLLVHSGWSNWPDMGATEKTACRGTAVGINFPVPGDDYAVWVLGTSNPLGHVAGDQKYFWSIRRQFVGHPEMLGTTWPVPAGEEVDGDFVPVDTGSAAQTFDSTTLDCNDTAAAATPFGEEKCDGLDNDCNGAVDDAGASSAYVQSDFDNCGACGRHCFGVNFQACVGGHCVCRNECGGNCVDPFTDAAHCGACGTACKAGDVCSAGHCQSGCAPLAPCGNGCADLGKDAANCGACGLICSSNHIVNPACAIGICTGACDTGFADCDSNKLGNGCEVELATDVAHCGACSNVCGTVIRGQSKCVGGACRVSACDTGFGDCNANFADGCEMNLDGDVANCGACGLICSSNHIANPACATGICTGACDTGFADCDSNKLGNGCEVELATDVAHCGACGNACPAGKTCRSGTCVDLPDMLPPLDLTVPPPDLGGTTQPDLGGVGDMDGGSESSDLSGLCANSVKDPGETDVDCGGGTCPACVDGKICVQPSDCMSGGCSLSPFGTKQCRPKGKGVYKITSLGDAAFLRCVNAVGPTDYSLVQQDVNVVKAVPAAFDFCFLLTASIQATTGADGESYDWDGLTRPFCKNFHNNTPPLTGFEITNLTRQCGM